VIRRTLAFLVGLAATALGQSSSPISVVNSASYQSTIAPDSLASIIGTNLATAIASATLDADGNLPIELASTSVTINGQTARLIYVSPSQINFLVPADIGSGTTTLTVSHSDTPATRTGSVTIAATSPGLFSSDASGSGPGAIRNAVTFAGPPFLVDTPESPSDPRTRLAIYGTGFRNAKDLTVRAGDTRGNRFDLTVEYAGQAPGFAGLDQINVVLPAGLDGGGAAALIATADTVDSNSVTAQINLLPVARLRLSGITLTPDFVNGGDPMQATIQLNGIARSGGFPVSLRSTSLAAQPPGIVTIPENSPSVQTTVNTSAVNTVQTGRIQASASAVTVSADFEIDPPTQAALNGFSISPQSVLGGRTLSGTVLLTNPAPPGGLNIQLASDNDAVRPPSAITVPFTQNSATFNIPTVAVNAPVNATVTATQSRYTFSAKVAVLPPMTFTVDTTSVAGGALITGTITLAEPAPLTGAQINLSSNLPAVASVPANLTIQNGLTLGLFTITTSRVNSSQTAVITAKYQNTVATVSITVTTQPTPELATMNISPSTIAGGTSTQGTVTLTAPAGLGGFRVNFQSSNSLTAQVQPPFIMIQQGFTTGIFTVTTTRVVTPQTVTITATGGSTTKTAVLTVQ